MTRDEIKELITRRRNQLLVHSCIYYRFNDSLITDHQYDSWCLELIDLQTEYSEIASECKYHEHFKDFQMGDSFVLPHYLVLGLAKQLVNYHREEVNND